MLMESLGKNIIFFGIVLVVIGAVLVLLGRFPWIGKLPGDIIIKREGFTIYFPIVTMLIVSVILTALFNIVGRK